MDVFEIHKGGKLEVISKTKIDSKEKLSTVYTPGVAKVCSAIAEDKSKAKEYTIAGNTVAIVSDGTAVLGLGDIGPSAALPVMEGKAAIFKEFAGINAFPICLDTKDPDEIINTVRLIAPNFAAVNLEDISAPRCFEIEEKLDEILDIPVMHDDQHGTAIVTLAALKGALRLSDKSNLRIIVNGAGAAGTAITKLLSIDKVKTELKIQDIKVIDSKGVIALDREDLNSNKKEIAVLTDQRLTLNLIEAIKDSDVFIGVSVADVLTEDMVKSMNSKPIIFAMANPNPEILPDMAKNAGAWIVATGRSDFPNQINNALAYPGVFKGLIESGIKKATNEVKLAAVDAIFEYHEANLTTENILPSILDKEVPTRIAQAISLLA